MKKNLPFALCFLAALLLILGAYFSVSPKLAATIDNWYILSFAMACCLGFANLSVVHLKNVTRKGTGWGYSVLLIVTAFFCLALGFSKGMDTPLYQWIFNTTLIPIGAATMSLNAFYITSASYRAFRAKSLDAILLLASGLIVLLGNAPITETIHPGFRAVSSWIMEVPNTAALRAVLLGSLLGSMITGLRVFAGMDRPYSAGGERGA